MLRIFAIFFGLFFFIIDTQIFATTYYIDQTGGNDSNSGTSTGQAWKTMLNVNAGDTSFFTAGNTISFKKGEIWREQLDVPNTGTNGNPLTINSYGSGNKPKIYGSANLSTASGTSWDKTNPTTQTADIWNEAFEAPGFQGGGYTLDVGVGNTIIDNSQAITPPTNGGSYIGYFNKVSTVNARLKKYFSTAYSTFYARADINVSNISSLSTSTEYGFFELDDTEYGSPLIKFYITKINNSSFQISLRSNYNGTDNIYTGGYAASLNTWYKV